MPLHLRTLRRDPAPQATTETAEELMARFDRRWKNPQAAWGARWERPLSIVGAAGFGLLAVMFLLSQLGVV
ncbi:MAG: hypothetical protein HFJ75_01005 [Eggerthellaceae bacterium]|nr:hypothetical protein [Eggerthellaceae bacterium]